MMSGKAKHAGREAVNAWELCSGEGFRSALVSNLFLGDN